MTQEVTRAPGDGEPPKSRWGILKAVAAAIAAGAAAVTALCAVVEVLLALGVI